MASHGASPCTETQVTFVMAAYNASSTIRRAISSIESQTCRAWSLIIVDDGSSDDTLEIAKKVAADDSRILAIAAEHGGTAAARNQALNFVDTGYVGYIDADDEVIPTYLQEMLDFVSQNPGHEIYSCDGRFVYDAAPSEPVLGLTKSMSVTIDNLIERCWILGGGALVEASLLRRLGGFDRTRYAEDYDLWLRAIASGARHMSIPRKLYVYHRSVSGQKSEDAVSGTLSKIQTLQSLIDSGGLCPSTALKAAKEISACQKKLEPPDPKDTELRAHAAEQGVRAKQWLHQVLGREHAEQVIVWVRGWSGKTVRIRTALGRIRRRDHR